MKERLAYTLPINDVPETPEQEALGCVRSGFGVKDQHRMWSTPALSALWLSFFSHDLGIDPNCEVNGGRITHEIDLTVFVLCDQVPISPISLAELLDQYGVQAFE